jgi:hypothetical protein
MLLLFVFSYALADPGYRPSSDLSNNFVNQVAAAEIAVFPTVIRGGYLSKNTSAPQYISRYSSTSQQLVIKFLSKNNLGTARPVDVQPYPGDLQGITQLEMFHNRLQTIGPQLDDYKVAADYIMAIEIILAPSRQGVTEVSGIYFFVLERGGNNAFSFLLNSHHKVFANAKLRTSDMTATGSERLAIKGTKIALAALKKEIVQARECAARGLGARKVQSNIFDNFETGLHSGTDSDGVPLGFSIFDDEISIAKISTTSSHPPLLGELAGNKVLKLDLNVRGWAGVFHTFENEAVDRWVSYDWRSFGELSFWLYGNNSGTWLFVDVFDNRNPCSTKDDTERYRYEFVDDFSGWGKVTVPFADMDRDEIGNGAPNDGLDLSNVHGWEFGALNTGGNLTYYIDDVGLSGTPLHTNAPSSGGGTADYTIPINELPMYGEAKKTAWQKQADDQFIKSALPRFFNDPVIAAEYYSRTGWNHYYEGDKTLAIKRFNQAWLLEPRNRHALWGFAVISLERGDIRSAVRFYEMALENGPEHPKIREEYEKARRGLRR